jgi:hypothetical protein
MDALPETMVGMILASTTRRRGTPYTCNHKVLTYIEYRAVSGVFRTIDPYPRLGNVSLKFNVFKA